MKNDVRGEVTSLQKYKKMGKLVSVTQALHEHNNKGLSGLRCLSLGIRVNTREINSTSGTLIVSSGFNR